MDIGKEISYKIRDAIKAKLVDLGAYVDEELPDYIMVMIANKKTTDQMRDDLQLFLSHNTDKFTEWLDTVIHKLQSATVEDSLKAPPVELEEIKPSEPLSAPQSAPPSQPPKKSRKGKDSKSSKTKHSKKVKEPLQEEPKEVVSSVVKEPEPPVIKEPEPSIVVEEVRPDDPSQAIITLTPETGDFDEELNPEPIEMVVPPPQKVEKLQETSEAQVAPIVSIDQDLVPMISEDSREDCLDKRNVTQISTSPMSIIGESGSLTRTVKTDSKAYTTTRKTQIHSRLGVRTQRPPIQNKYDKNDKPRKYMLGSVVGQVIEDEDDDDNLPVTKQGLTSVVKPKRRPTLPPSKQANKSLLVRAMSDAQRSTIKVLNRKKASAVKIVRPSVKGKTLPRNLLSRAITNATMTEIQTRIHQNPRTQPELEKNPFVSEEPVSVKSKPSNLIPLDLDSSECITLVPSEEGFEVVMGNEQDEIVSSVRHVDVERDVEEENELDQRIRNITYADERVVKTTAKVPPVIMIKEPEIAPTPPKPVNNPRFIVTLAGADNMRNQQQRRAPKRARVKAQIPVIRTVHNESMNTSVPSYKATSKDVLLTRVNQVVEEKELYTFENQVVRGGDIRGFASRLESVVPMARVETDIPVVALQSTPKVNQVSFSLHDSEDEEMEDVSGPKKQKILERCLFWPACKNGDVCTYVHPTTKCVTFPKCKFGDKCLYIHPNCKFDAKCTRSDCPYTHATRTKPNALPSPPVSPPLKMTSQRPLPAICKFHPGCQNPTCTFQHPKPCRFGSACTRPNCVFSHPKVVRGSALKWTKNVQKSSSLLSSIPNHIAL
ncbi:zinc finger CCCH domain-containing protein 14-like [Antedon mediterranea]|uniref:zinc finger CCCH domain-containing protein 14-like n=1 Tax=Antedon mediterranea TaxID=105859 RepID=UPI003AF691C9